MVDGDISIFHVFSASLIRISAVRHVEVSLEGFHRLGSLQIGENARDNRRNRNRGVSFKTLR